MMKTMDNVRGFYCDQTARLCLAKERSIERLKGQRNDPKLGKISGIFIASAIGILTATPIAMADPLDDVTNKAQAEIAKFIRRYWIIIPIIFALVAMTFIVIYAIADDRGSEVAKKRIKRVFIGVILVIGVPTIILVLIGISKNIFNAGDVDQLGGSI